jgi:hypothetical protein
MTARNWRVKGEWRAGSWDNDDQDNDDADDADADEGGGRRRAENEYESARPTRGTGVVRACASRDLSWWRRGALGNRCA